MKKESVQKLVNQNNKKVTWIKVINLILKLCYKEIIKEKIMKKIYVD